MNEYEHGMNACVLQLSMNENMNELLPYIYLIPIYKDLHMTLLILKRAKACKSVDLEDKVQIYLGNYEWKCG